MIGVDPIQDFQAVLQAAGGSSVTWAPVGSTLALTYTLSRSVDGGKTWSVVATFAHDLTAGNFDTATQLFTVSDGSGAPGVFYRLLASDGTNSRTKHFIVAPTLPLVHVFGFLVDPAGQQLHERDRVVLIEYLGDYPMHNIASLVGDTARNIGVAERMVRARANNEGLWQVELLQGIRARFSIPSIDFIRVTKLPEENGPFNLTDLPVLDDYPKPGYQRGAIARRK